MKIIDNEKIRGVAQSELDEIMKIEAPARAKLSAASNDPREAALETEIKNCRAQMVVLEKRSPNCTDPTCLFIATAVKASENLPALEAELNIIEMANSNAINDAGTVINTCIKRQADAARRKADAESRIAAARADIKTEQAGLAKLEALLNLRGDIAAAVERKSAIEARIAELKAEGMAKKSELEQRQKADADSATGLDDLIRQTEQTLDHSAAGALMNAESEISALKKSKYSTEQTLISLQAQRESIILKLSEAKAAEKKLNMLCSDIAALQNEAAEWLYIQNATGKNGLRALEIDGVAPCITNYANSLLSATYGPTFSVRIQTQNDEGKECFDILVCNSEGEETPLDNLSGGQKCWILMSLRLAMTLVSKQKSGIKFETAFADEIDGALDVENAKTFASMYQAFMREGGMQSLFFITHKPECVCLSDHQIIFSDNGISIN